MNNLLSKLVPFKKGESVTDNPEVTDRLNALMELVRGLARGDNIVTGGSIRKATGSGNVVLVGDVPAAPSVRSRPLPFQVSIVSAPSDSGGGPRARIYGGWVYQSTSAHGSAKTTLEWIHIPTSYPPEEGGDGPWDTDLGDGDNWVYLSNKLLGENPTSMDPPMASWTDTEADTFKGVALAYISVDITDETQDLFQYHIGNVFVDNNFNLRSSGSLVGYKAELEEGTSETAADLAFKMIAGADPILTLFKGIDSLTWNAIKADYIGMITDGSVGPEVALSRTSGRYLSLKPAYVEMQNDAGTKRVVVNSDGDTEVSLSHTSGKYTSVKAAYIESQNDAGTQKVVINTAVGPEVSLSRTSGKYTSIKAAYIEMQNDAATKKCTIEVDTEALIYLLGVNPKLRLQGDTDWLEAASNQFSMGHSPAIYFEEGVRINSDGDVALGKSPIQLTFDPSGVLKVAKTVGFFQADGGDLTGQSGDGADNYSLQEITYLDKDGNAKKVKGYFSAPEDATGVTKEDISVCVDGTATTKKFLIAPT